MTTHIMPTNIVVIGAGVTGLSCAVELQQAGHTSITLLARDFPVTSALVDPVAQINYTSPWGGAHNRWVPPPPPPPPGPDGATPDDGAAATTTTTTTTTRDHALALATFHQMRALAHAHPEAGITLMKGVEYLERPGPEYVALAREGEQGRGPGSARALGLPGFRLLREDEFPDDRVAMGFEYDTWCVNPMVYCAFLLNRFVYRGGNVVKKDIRDPREVFEMGEALGLGVGGRRVDLVVNASGTGFGDDKMFVTRGQTCLVANRVPATITRQNADGTWTFCVPRNYEGGTIIGGTKEPDNWDPNPSLEVRERLLRNFAATYPPIAQSGDVTVLQDVVGRRPTRHGGARIEREDIAPGRSIVHAYGLGGRGYEMSWGVARTVRELVDGHKSGPAKPRL